MIVALLPRMREAQYAVAGYELMLDVLDHLDCRERWLLLC